MKIKDVAAGQRTLFNFDVVDPFAAPSVELFREQFKRLNRRNPSARELTDYYDKHPKELARRREQPRK